MKHIANVLLGEKSTIKDAMQLIDSNSSQIAIVVDDVKRLIGTITDGDIRRGLLNGVGIDESIDLIINKHPTICDINESKETLAKISLEKDIKQIPLIDSDGIVVGLEIFSDLFKISKRTNKVILMAGGLGTRLRPLTQETPKPLLKVGNKPIIETIIKSFANYGFEEIVLCVNYKSHMLEDYFGNGSQFGVNIDYIHEKERMGTAGALGLIKSQLNEPFFVMNADLLTNVNFEHFLDYHISHESSATMAVREYDFQVPYGVVNIDNSRVVSIDEKPVHRFFVSAGIYLLGPDVLKYIPPDQFFDMPTLFEILIEKNKCVSSFPIREYWLDIGRINDFEQANNEYHQVFGDE